MQKYFKTNLILFAKNKKVIEFAHKNDLVVVNDAAHIVLTYGRKPLSFLSIDGAKEVGIEIHSMSKGFDMIGWRIGFFAGNAKIVRAIADIKDNSDSGQFMAIQKAGVAGLELPKITQSVRAKYERRLQKLVSTLNSCGFKAEMPGGTYFLYVKAPSAAGEQKFNNAEDASQFLIRQLSICTVPWDEAGAHLRFSVTYQAPTEADEDKLMTTLKERLSGTKLSW